MRAPAKRGRLASKTEETAAICFKLSSIHKNFAVRASAVNQKKIPSVSEATEAAQPPQQNADASRPMAEKILKVVSICFQPLPFASQR